MQQRTRCALEYLPVTLAKNGDSSPFVHCPNALGLGRVGGSMSLNFEAKSTGRARRIRLLTFRFLLLFFAKFFAFYVRNYENYVGAAVAATAEELGRTRAVMYLRRLLLPDRVRFTL